MDTDGTLDAKWFDGGKRLLAAATILWDRAADGPDGDRVSQALTNTLPGGDRNLDLLIMTHLDSDHSRGLLDALDRYVVGAVLSAQQPPGGEMQA